ncbi:hypothetical protein C5167_042713 [Papaver somniferum]|uniref:DHFR domain-containing protein n=1 Tax=Papaver somniferum TaxID=3469 RepID=A0A4Y7L4M3_PAPSO|nr:hypothetical protein C5167_042713 [Papaver somniferum]
MDRKTWESIPTEYRPLPGRLNVVLTRSGSFDIATAENVISCSSMSSALELLAASPYCLSIEKFCVIGGGQVLRKALNAPGCDAILPNISFLVILSMLFGDAHVYKTHVRPLQKQFQKLPRPFPTLKISSEKKDIDSFVATDFKLMDYDPRRKIEMKMAVFPEH